MRNRWAPSAVRTAISRLPRLAAGEHQVGDVGTGDEQHEADRAEQDEQHGSGVAETILSQRANKDAEVALIVLVGIRASQARDDAVHLGGGGGRY